MIACSKCGAVQKVSKFCGQCGNALQTTEQQEVNNNQKMPAQNSATSHEEAMPNQARRQSTINIWAYFVGCLKAPSNYMKETHFTYAIISTLIALALFVFIPFQLVNRWINIVDFQFSAFLNLTEVMHRLTIGDYIKMFLAIGVLYAILLAITFILGTKWGSLKSWKLGMAKIGVLNSYMIVTFVVVLLVTFFISILFSISLYIIVAMLFMLFVPLYVAVTSYNKSHKLDPFVRYFITAVIYLVFFLIVYQIFYGSDVNEMYYSIFGTR